LVIDEIPGWQYIGKEKPGARISSIFVEAMVEKSGTTPRSSPMAPESMNRPMTMSSIRKPSLTSIKPIRPANAWGFATSKPRIASKTFMPITISPAALEPWLR
jgi:hypothetical protein